MPSTRSSSESYIPQLDALRAVAVAGVMFTHYVPASVPLVGVPGFVGVRLFFVMSGFLITRILLAARTAPPRTVARAFYARRFLRIFPLYYAACALMCLSSKSIRVYAPWLFSYTQNIKFALDGRYPVVAHLWSLAVEEQFYVFWPWLVLLIRPARLERILVICVGTAIVSRALIFALTNNDVSAHVLPVACLDTLGAGALLALAHSRGVYPALARWQVVSLFAVFCALTAALLSTRTTWLFHVFAEGVLAILFADLVGGISAAPRESAAHHAALDRPSLQHLGKISYGIYVIHFFVPNQIARVLVWLRLPSTPPRLLVAALSVAVTVALAELSWHYFEGPLNRLKRHFLYQGAALGISPVVPEKKEDALRSDEGI